MIANRRRGAASSWSAACSRVLRVRLPARKPYDDLGHRTVVTVAAARDSNARLDCHRRRSGMVSQAVFHCTRPSREPTESTYQQ